MTGLATFGAVFLLGLVIVSYGRIFDSCELADELRNNGVPEGDILIWVCIAHASSYYKSDEETQSENGVKMYGIFQITDYFHCDDVNPYSKDCNVTCKALIQDDITDSIKCALYIRKTQGFKAWSAWGRQCINKTEDLKPYVCT